MTCRILVADDSTPIQKVIKIAFSKYAVEILTAGSLAEAVKECEKSRPELIIADASLPGVASANDLTRLLGKSQGAAMIVLMGSYDSVRDPDLRAAGLESILKKPFDAIELLEACERMIPGRLTAASAPGLSNVSGQNKLPQPPQEPFASPPLPPPPMAMPMETPKVAPQPKQSLHSETPGIPSFLLDGPQDELVVPAIPSIDMARKGQPAFSAGIPPVVSEPRATEIPPIIKAPVQPKTPSAESINPVAALQDAAEELIRRELPGLVERAVSRYCAENFKEIAKEVITQELRRLADEKARYLLDQ